MKKCFFITFLFLFSLNSSAQENLSFTVNGVSFNMVYVEGGTFIMGCSSEDGICYPGERPAHIVTLTDYFIGEFEVTQELWYAVMGTTVAKQWLKNAAADRKKKSKLGTSSMWDVYIGGELVYSAEDYSKVISLPGEGNIFPMYYINYSDCELFCSRLTQSLSDQLPEGYRFRMPTEAQWEYAARGGNKSRNYTYSGSNNIDEVAWYIRNSEEKTSVAGKKLPNELGIYDMSGNVWEWCRDRYNENYYSNSPAVNPKGPEKGKEYVLRGGSWDKTGWCCRVATRMKDDPAAHTTNYGFRLVLEPPPKLTGSGFFGYTGNFTTSRLASGRNLSFKVNNAKLEMIFVQGGTFLMGCPSEIMNCDSIEKPAHNVTIANYYLGKFEITQKLWHAVMGTTVGQQRDSANPEWNIYGEGDNYPIYYVSYEECVQFCEKLNKMLYYQLPEGYKFTLPTEAQWEYAARGGKKNSSYKYSGSNKASKVAWYSGNNRGKTSVVGLKASNELGFFDMSGNVWEWCRDWFEEDYYRYCSNTNPQGPLSGFERVLRGGSWNLEEWHSRNTTRYYYVPEGRLANVGFRIALQPAKDFFDVKSVKEAVKKLSPKFDYLNNRNFNIGNVNFEMVFVVGGTFTMGCTSNISDCFHNEKPFHSVTLSDFYLGKFQVTQELWKKVMGTDVQQQRDLGNPEWELCGEGDLLPMYYINYDECVDFCNKLNSLLAKQLPEGYKFAIPTEAQWEYAARGGKKSKGYSYSGGDNLDKVAWYDRNSKDQVREVGTKKKNELGIYDMTGNVWEWCRDWLGTYTAKPSTDPTGPKSGNYRVLRGGSWRTLTDGCRLSHRFAVRPYERTRSYGLRLVLVKE